MRTPIIKFHYCTSDQNFHGPKGATKKLTASIVQMDAHCQYWSLYLYGPKGQWIRFEVAFPRWRREWRS